MSDKGNLPSSSRTQSPIKVINPKTLPPIDKDEAPKKVNVRKKREFQLAADEHPSDPKIPSKQRCLSSPSVRVGSLKESSKPDLTPPSLLVSYKAVDESSPITGKVATKTVDGMNETPSKPEKPQKSVMELRRQENALDSKIRSLSTKIETLKSAKKVLAQNSLKDNKRLVNKWRNIAQKASNYLLNAAQDKVNRQGGKLEFLKKEKDKLKGALEYSIDSSFQDRYGEITNSEEYENMNEEEQEKVIGDLDKEQERAMADLEKSISDQIEVLDEDEEFTMKDLYKQLKLDYKAIYPHGQSTTE